MVADERIVEKERVKAEKAKKFAEKQAKLATAQSLTQSSKTSEKKNKAKNEEQLPEYVEETPKGQKKSMYFHDLLNCGLIDSYSSQATRRRISQGVYPKSCRVCMVRLVGKGRLFPA